ncbi:MAG: hypothetical protein EB121_05070, partial [Alphaproteobacteria bacterium]|nr:hypothetical protein [Alphaproteobacteria bacterium]
NLAAEIEDLKSENNSLLALIEQTHHVHKLAKRHRTLRRPQPFWRATPLPDPRRPARGLADPLTLMVAVLLNKKLLGLNF